MEYLKYFWLPNRCAESFVVRMIDVGSRHIPWQSEHFIVAYTFMYDVPIFYFLNFKARVYERLKALFLVK